MENINIKLEFYQDKANEWRWRAIGMNGEKVANCGEGYKNKSDCVSIAERLFSNATIDERIGV